MDPDLVRILPWIHVKMPVKAVKLDPRWLRGDSTLLRNTWYPLPRSEWSMIAMLTLQVALKHS